MEHGTCLGPKVSPNVVWGSRLGCGGVCRSSGPKLQTPTVQDGICVGNSRKVKCNKISTCSTVTSMKRSDRKMIVSMQSTIGCITNWGSRGERTNAWMIVQLYSLWLSVFCRATCTLQDLTTCGSYCVNTPSQAISCNEGLHSRTPSRLSCGYRRK